MNKNLNKSLGKFYQKKENVQETLYGELGIPLNGKKAVDVPGRLGYVYVRLRGNASELIQAYNSTVPSKYDYPVVVARKGNKYTILGRDDQRFSNMGNAGNTVTSVNYSPVPNHGGQHSFSVRNGIGADPTWVYGEQFMPNLIHPSGSSLQLAISPSFYEWEGQWKYPSTTGTIDLSPYVPTVTGSARFALLYIDGDTTEIKVAGGVGFSGGINNAAHLAQYIPDVDRNSSIPLAAVKLGTGTTSIDWTNIYDVRDYYTVAKYFEGIGIQDSTTAKGTGTILNFGNNLSVSMAGGVATIDATAGGGGGGGIGIMGWDEGIPLGTGTILNFVGDNVDASISGSVIRVHVTGSASGGNPPTTGSIVIIDEGVTKGSVTALNVVSSVADISVSGTVARLFITGSASGGSNPPVTGSIVLWDEGVLKGSATILDVVSSIADVSISGTVARLFITGSASSGGGTATYLRAGQPTPLAAHTTGTYWKTPEPYATGSLAVFNQGHALIIDVDYSEQYPESGTYSYTEAQPTGTYHLAIYGVPVSAASSTGSASSASLSGYMPYAFPLGYDIWANNSSDPLVANGGTVVIPIALSSTMLLQSVSCRNGDTGLARSWRWDLYVQSETSDTSLTRVATSDGSDSFTASGASIRTLNVSGAPVTVDPGLYWLAVQNDEASNTFDLRTHNSSVFQPNMIREKTTSIPNGASLDMSSGWSTLVHTRQIRLDGRVFGESSAF